MTRAQRFMGLVAALGGLSCADGSPGGGGAAKPGAGRYIVAKL